MALTQHSTWQKGLGVMASIFSPLFPISPSPPAPSVSPFPLFPHQFVPLCPLAPSPGHGHSPPQQSFKENALFSSRLHQALTLQVFSFSLLFVEIKTCHVLSVLSVPTCPSGFQYPVFSLVTHIYLLLHFV